MKRDLTVAVSGWSLGFREFADTSHSANHGKAVGPVAAAVTLTAQLAPIILAAPIAGTSTVTPTAIAVSSLSLAVVAIILVNVTAVFYVFDELHGNRLMLGLLNARWMIGMIIGARASAKARTERAMIGAPGAVTITMGLALLTPALLALVPAMAAGYLLGGMANGIQNVTIQPLTKLRSRPTGTAGPLPR